MIRSLVISENAQKQLRKVPRYVAEKLADWVLAVEADGLEEIRKVPGYHDEPLRGKRAGQPSIRLSRAYRAIYIISHGALEFVSVEEVHKHDY